MNRSIISIAGALTAGLLLAACSASVTGGTPTPATSLAATSAPSSSAATPTAAPISSQTAQPTSLDPCQVVTASEASSLAGTTYGTGTEQTTSGNGKICLYGSETRNVFEVFVAVASDAATAQSDWSTYEGKVESLLNKGLPAGVNANFNVNDTSVSGADRAAVGTFSVTESGVTISGSAIYMLSGAIFVAFSDLQVGGGAPSSSAMESEATTAIGRV